MLRIATAKYFASFEQFLKHLPLGRDDDLLILKGHLLIERLIERFHEAELPQAERLKDSRLTFAQKVAIASALRRDPGDDWLWDALHALNRLRNELVHQLPGSRLEELRAAFLAIVEKSPDLPHLEPPPDMHDRLHRAIFSVHEAMSHRVNL